MRWGERRERERPDEADETSDGVVVVGGKDGLEGGKVWTSTETLGR